MTDSMKNGQEGEEENYIPKNPDGEFEIRNFLGHGDVYTQWLQRITETDRLIQQERLKTYGKDLPQYLPDGERITRQGYRMGLRYLTPAERSKGRKPGGRDKAVRLSNEVFDTNAQKRFLNELAKSGNILQSAAAQGWSRHTIYRAMNNNKKFAEAVEIARENVNGKVRQSILDRILNGEEIIEKDAKGDVIKTTVRPVNSALAIKWIESTQKEEFGKRSEVTTLHIGEGGDSNSRLMALAQKLNVALPDNSKDKEDDDILDIN